MSKARPDFKRMLLKLPHDRQDYAAVGVIAELADLFGVDLIGTYVEDLDLRGLADLPDVRGFVPALGSLSALSSLRRLSPWRHARQNGCF